jgi:FixJ family two-component response regulator
VAPKQPLIACVDDDLWARDALQGLVRALGFTPVAFSSAEEFLQSEQLNDTSCLITDLHLRGMSGLRLQSRLAALDYRFPVIVITAFPNARIREQALSAGAVCFLDKPFTAEDLLSGLRSALHDRHGADAEPSASGGADAERPPRQDARHDQEPKTEREGGNPSCSKC